MPALVALAAIWPIAADASPQIPTRRAVGKHLTTNLKEVSRWRRPSPICANLAPCWPSAFLKPIPLFKVQRILTIPAFAIIAAKRRNRGSTGSGVGLHTNPKSFVLKRLGIQPEWHGSCRSRRWSGGPAARRRRAGLICRMLPMFTAIKRRRSRTGTLPIP